MAFELGLKDIKGSERRKEGYPGGGKFQQEARKWENAESAEQERLDK